MKLTLCRKGQIPSMLSVAVKRLWNGSSLDIVCPWRAGLRMNMYYDDDGGNDWEAPREQVEAEKKASASARFRKFQTHTYCSYSYRRRDSTRDLRLATNRLTVRSDWPDRTELDRNEICDGRRAPWQNRLRCVPKLDCQLQVSFSFVQHSVNNKDKIILGILVYSDCDKVEFYDFEWTERS